MKHDPILQVLPDQKSKLVITSRRYDSINGIQENPSEDCHRNKEFWIILKASLPLVTTFFLQFSLTLVSIFSVGHIGKDELAAVSLAIMTFNVSVSIFNGMATCLDTLCAQAYGAKRYDLVGIYFQKCTCMILAAYIPMAFIWCFSSHLFALIVPDRKLAVLAEKFLRGMSLGAPGYIFFETGKRFLQAQGIFVAGQYCLFIAAPINLLLNYLLVWNKHFGIGLYGAPLSTSISYWLMSLLLLCYVRFIDGKKCWDGINLQEALRGWGTMFNLALNGTAMMLSEFVAFEILTLSVSRLGTASLAAQSITSSLATLLFQIPFGISVAASTRIAYHVGAGSINMAKMASRITLNLALVVGVLSFLVVFIFRANIVRIFTTDQEVVKYATVSVGILGINQLFDCSNVLLAGCLRGQGRQHIGSALNIFAYYVIAVPLALHLAFKTGLGLKGLWIGIGIGVSILAISEGYFVLFRSNWPAILQSAQKRNSLGS